jgi:hypothetical protein
VFQRWDRKRALFDLGDESCEDVPERFQPQGPRRDALAALDGDGLAFLGDFHCEAVGVDGENGTAGPITRGDGETEMWARSSVCSGGSDRPSAALATEASDAGGPSETRAGDPRAQRFIIIHCEHNCPSAIRRLTAAVRFVACGDDNRCARGPHRGLHQLMCAVPDQRLDATAKMLKPSMATATPPKWARRLVTTAEGCHRPPLPIVKLRNR